jgi:Glycosyltransferase 61
MITTRRTKPLNLVPEDLLLFERELERKVPDPEVTFLKHAFVLGNAICFHKGRRVKESLPIGPYDQHFGWRYFFKERLSYKWQFVLDSRNYLLALDAWSFGYFHWMTDALPRIFFGMANTKDFVLLLPEMYNEPYHRQSLEVLGIHRIKWLKKNTITYIKNLYLSHHQGTQGNYNPGIIRNIGSIFRQTALNLGFGDRIYISRTKALRRKIVNEQEVIRLLNEKGFREVCFEDYDLEQQISIAAQARYLVALHGCGLTNILFMQPGSNVLELRQDTDNRNNCYFSLASELAVNYFYQNCRSVHAGLVIQNNDLIVDTELLKKNVDQMLGNEVNRKGSA